jgi:hypothetical protein
MKFFDYFALIWIIATFLFSYEGAKDMYDAGSSAALMAGGVGVLTSLPLLGGIYVLVVIFRWASK